MTNRLLVVAWVIILAFLLVLAVDSFIETPGSRGDTALFVYVAQGILQGEIPYLDRWDNKGPLLYLIHAIGLMINQVWGMWAVQTLFLLGSVYFAFILIRRVFGLYPALFSLAVLLTYYSKFGPPGSFTEQFNLLFQFLTLILFIRSEEEAKAAPTQGHFAILHAGIGALGAASFLLRPNLVSLWIVIGLYWLLMRDTSLRKLAWAAIGGGGTLVIAAGLFLALGALGALWDAVFVFNFAHSGVSLQDRIGVVAQLIVQMFPVVLLAIAGWCLGIMQLIRRQLTNRSIRSLLAISSLLLPLELVGLSLSGYAFKHYFIATLPIITILLAFLLHFILARRLIAPLALSLALLLAAAYYTSPSSSFTQLAEKYVNTDALPGIGETSEAVRLRSLIQDSTSPGDTILVWGKGAWIYLIAERNAASRYFYEVPLTMPNYTSQAKHEEFLSDIKQQEPRLIVHMPIARVPPLTSASQNKRLIAHLPITRVPPLTSVKRNNWTPHPRFMYDPGHFQPFFDYVEENYVIVDLTPPFIVYALRRDDYEAPEFPADRLIVSSVYDVYLNGKTLTYVKDSCTHDDTSQRFILHVIPVDNSVIAGRAHATQDFDFLEAKEWHIGEACVVSIDLPEYPIAAIRTGQYNAERTAHQWLSEYQFPKPN